MRVVLPHDFKPRPYQAEFMRYMDGGNAGRRKRAVLVWPRRSGKDLTVLHQTAKLAMQRPGFYVYGLPTYNQARRVCWQGFLSDGRPLLEAVFPRALVKERREVDMALRLANGSLLQFVGADTIDRLVGTNPVGVVLSEMALAKPSVFDFLRPMLAQNDGWFVGQSTPRGRNHFFRLFEAAKASDTWFASHKTIEQTHSMPMAAIDEEIHSGMDPALARQEFWCSFDAANVGSVFGDLLETLETQGRCGDFQHDVDGLFTSWDLGFSDSTAIWVWHLGDSGGVDYVDHYESHGQPLSHYFDVLDAWAQEKGYRYVKHWLPHDARAKTMQTGSSILEQCIARWGGEKVAIVPQLSLLDGVQAGRWLLQQPTRFHARCEDGVEALRQYAYTYDEDKKTFSRKPAHSWASHTADAFRYSGVVVRFVEGMTRKPAPLPTGPYARPIHNAFTLNELFEDNEAVRPSERI